MKALRWFGLLTLIVLSGWGVDRWVSGLYARGPQQRLAAAMAGLFAGGLVALVLLVAGLLQRRG